MNMTVDPSMRRRVVLSSTIGNALEWFDFSVFGLFAVVISQLFFPAHSPTGSLLKTFATFGIAFVARPLGGLLFGLYADRHGRKKALVFMVLMMAAGTGLIGIVPPFAVIGVAAPLLVLVARLMQGISAGGEFGSASAMLIEFASPGRRGLYGSFQIISQSLSFVMGAAAAYALTECLAPADFQTWGWRIPFLLGILIGPVGFLIRQKVDESPEFLAFRQSTGTPRHQPVKALIRDHRREMAVVFCLTAFVTSVTYVTIIFLPTFVSTDLGLHSTDAQLGLVGTNLCSALVAPLGGHLSDRFGRRTIILPTMIVFCVLYGLFLSQLVAFPSVSALWKLQALGILIGFMAGPLPALMTEIFPVGVRSTGASLMYNLAVMLFGGLAPFINTALVEVTGNKLASFYYLVFAAAVGVVGLLLHRPRKFVEPLTSCSHNTIDRNV